MAEQTHMTRQQRRAAQREVQKTVEKQQRHLRQPMSRGEVYAFLQQIDNGMKKMDRLLSQNHNAIAFLVSKGVFDQAEFDAWDKEQTAKIEAEKAKQQQAAEQAEAK